jgi:hypothetical protein
VTGMPFSRADFAWYAASTLSAAVALCGCEHRGTERTAFDPSPTSAAVSAGTVSALPTASPTSAVSPSPGAPSDLDLDVQVRANHQAYVRFLVELKSAAASHEKRRVAALVAFPVFVGVVGTRHKVTIDEAMFLREYESIVTPCVLGAIQNAKLDGLHGGWKGFRIGNVWFSEYIDGPRITTINNDDCADP